MPVPWYKRALRWGQTNITEIDPTRYDIAWWREHWRRTRVQGVIFNAGGIVSYYYPSSFPLTHYAQHLDGRDLFGELVEAARQEGLAVLARMDSNRIHPPLYQAHPDWAALDASGSPYRAGELYVACVDSPYYQEYLPGVLREIAARYHPDGFTDNSFSGLGRNAISYSIHAARRFKALTGLDLPARVDWDDPVYRRWIRASYERRLEIWEINTAAAREAGGPECLWIGMVSGDVTGQGANFRDLAGIAARAELLMVDYQSRPEVGGFTQNSETGLLLHNLLGWDKSLIESMAMYEHAHPRPFRVASKPEPEARLWALEGFAGGIHPWWHHIGAYHEDRRQYRTAEPLFRWHEQNQEYLVNRRPVAPVGVVWSQVNCDFYGRDAAAERVEQPWQGFTRALLRARIPYQPVHADAISRDADRLSMLALPNLGIITESQADAVRTFVEKGGSLIASGEAGCYDEWGDRRPDPALWDLLGVRPATTGPRDGLATDPGEKSDGWSSFERHTYLRLSPELRAGVYGPRTGQEPAIRGKRHAVLDGFEETDLLPFGGRLQLVEAEPGAVVPMTYVPPFPVYPPETAWMRTPSSHYPGLVLRELPSAARTAYLAADLDRCYALNPLPDHAHLLANLVRWAARDSLPLEVSGPGLLDCRLYRQPGRLVLHLVNLTGSDPRPVHELIPVGPIRVSVRLDAGMKGNLARRLVEGGEISCAVETSFVHFELDRIVDHEVVVIE
jgi:hypothetical protein